MRRLIPILWLFTVVPVASASVSFSVQADRELVQPGQTVTITVTVRNPDTDPTSGNYQNYIYIPGETGTTRPSASHAGVTCTGPSRTTVGGQTYWYYDCSSSGSVRLAGGESVTTTFQYTVPSTARPGDEIPFDSTVRFGATRLQRSVTLRVVAPSEAGPVLAVRFEDPTVRKFTKEVYYSVTITNVGNGPTKGDVSFSVAASYKFGLAPGMDAPSVKWESFSPIWRLDGSARVVTSAVLEPQRSWRLSFAVSFARVRTVLMARGVAEGGGAPRAEAAAPDVQIEDPRVAEGIRILPPAGTSGRR